MKFSIADIITFLLLIVVFVLIGITVIYLEESNPLGIITGILLVYLLNGGSDRIEERLRFNDPKSINSQKIEINVPSRIRKFFNLILRFFRLLLTSLIVGFFGYYLLDFSILVITDLQISDGILWLAYNGLIVFFFSLIGASLLLCSLLCIVAIFIPSITEKNPYKKKKIKSKNEKIGQHKIYIGGIAKIKRKK